LTAVDAILIGCQHVEITKLTEHVTPGHQAWSCGCMQIAGSCCKWIRYAGLLSQWKSLHFWPTLVVNIWSKAPPTWYF